jgi:D-alanyl-D-alanine carboxypeptidase (penicillin-binding protein 5/6)
VVIQSAASAFSFSSLPFPRRCLNVGVFPFLMKLARLTLIPLMTFAAFIPRDLVAQGGAGAYVIEDSASGHVLEQMNGDKQMQVASLSKIAMAMVVLDWAKISGRDLNELAVVPRAAAQLAPNPVGWMPGDRSSLRNLLYAALMQSDNIAAYTLAEHVAPSLPGNDPEVTMQEKFTAQMNALARKLGMENTAFMNPHGLDAGEKKPPYSTAKDLAKLTRYAMENAGFRFYVSQKERKINIEQFDGSVREYLLRNTNELLGINAIDGVKTGTTRRAGPCVIISAARPPETFQHGDAVTVIPRRLNVVVLNAADRFEVAGQLMKRGWALYDQWAAAGRPLQPAGRP